MTDEDKILINRYENILYNIEEILKNLDEAIINIDKGACKFDGTNFDKGKVRENYDNIVLLKKNIKKRLLDLYKTTIE